MQCINSLFLRYFYRTYQYASGLQPFAHSIGIPTHQSSYLLALLGIANTLGRIILGFISDKPWINRLMVYNVCLTICGIGENKSFLSLDPYFLRYTYICMIHARTFYTDCHTKVNLSLV